MRTVCLYLTLGGLIALLALLSLTFGAAEVSLRDMLAGNPAAVTVLTQLRLPRVLLALLAGAALGVSGALMQTYFRNPLAEPYVTGVSAGAALGAVLGTAAGLSHPLSIALVALVGAGAITTALYAFALRGRTTSGALLLLGIALGTLCGALVWLVLLRSGPTGSSQAIAWLLGRVATVGYDEVWALALAAAPGLLLAARLAPQLDTLLLGDEKAASLGLDVLRTRRLVLGAATLLAAACVALCGVIAFVGLMVPHVARRLTGSTHAALLPVAALGGAALVLAVDLASRTLTPPSEIPLTVLTSLLGAPFFIAVLLQSREAQV